MELRLDGRVIPCESIDKIISEKDFSARYDREEPALMQRLDKAAKGCLKERFGAEANIDVKMKHADSPEDALAPNPFNFFSDDGLPVGSPNSPSWFRI